MCYRALVQVPKALLGLQVEGDPRLHTWDPPPSPFSLIEEVLYQDPWRLLLACMLLNKTSGRAVRLHSQATSLAWRRACAAVATGACAGVCSAPQLFAVSRRS